MQWSTPSDSFFRKLMSPDTTSGALCRIDPLPESPITIALISQFDDVLEMNWQGLWRKRP
jgi:hypothetical protein